MQAISLELLGFIIGTIGFLLCFVYLRRCSNLETSIFEFAEQNEFLKAECSKLHTFFEKTRKKNISLEYDNAKLVKTNSQNEQRLQELEQEISTKEIEKNKLTKTHEQSFSESKTKLAKLENKLSSIEEKNLKLQNELKYRIKNQSEELQKKIKNLESDLKIKTEEGAILTQKNNQLETEAENKFSDLKEQLADEKSKRLEIEEKYQEISKQIETKDNTTHDEDHIAQITEKYRKRAQRANYFLNTMRGRKEMAEEKVRNWEVALSLLSSWVLEKKGHTNIPNALGPLVGEALAQIDKESALGELALEHDAGDELSSILSEA